MTLEKVTELDRTPNDCLLHINNISLVKVTEVPQLLEKVFRGGVEDNIRPEVEKLLKTHSFHCIIFFLKVWKFLLGYYQWHQPAEVCF